MSQTADAYPVLEPVMPPCPPWCREPHEPVKLRNENDNAVVDHVSVVGEMLVPDHFLPEPEDELATVSVAVVATDFFTPFKQHHYPPLIRMELTSNSFGEVLKLSTQHSRDFGQLLAQAARVLESFTRSAEGDRQGRADQSLQSLASDNGETTAGPVAENP
jgi:hypothetical protein